jgi:steroid delta-isomerase-like uncharacterized protein
MASGDGSTLTRASTVAEAQPTVSAPVDRAFVEEFHQRWLEAWNSHDADKVLACLAEDIVYDDSGWPTTMRGHAEVREFLDYSWRGFPDMRYEKVDGPYLDPDAPRAAGTWRCFATHTGPLDPPGLAPTGKRIEFEGTEFDEFRDGKLVRLRGVFDMADCMRQLGVLPPTGSRAERLTMRLANLRTRLRRRS